MQHNIYKLFSNILYTQIIFDIVIYSDYFLIYYILRLFSNILYTQIIFDIYKLFSIYINYFRYNYYFQYKLYTSIMLHDRNILYFSTLICEVVAEYHNYKFPKRIY